MFSLLNLSDVCKHYNLTDTRAEDMRYKLIHTIMQECEIIDQLADTSALRNLYWICIARYALAYSITDTDTPRLFNAYAQMSMAYDYLIEMLTEIAPDAIYRFFTDKEIQTGFVDLA